MAGPTTLFQTGVHASRPAAGAGCVLYSCTTHSLVYRSDGSAWTTWMTIPAGASMATDTIWDAAGDLAVGTGADTAAKLAKGAAGANLSTYNGTVAWNGGTSFPASPTTGDRYWRSDKLLEFVYDGTRWLCTCAHRLDFTSPTALMALSASGGGGSGNLDWGLGLQLYLQDSITQFFVASGGTALSGSHKWVGTINKTDSSNASTTIVTVTVDSGSSAAWRQDKTSINAAIDPATYMRLASSWTKTGTPGSLTVLHSFTYRIIGT